MDKQWKRRDFVVAASAAAIGSAQGATVSTGEPALLGGKPVRSQPFLSWPVADEREDRAIVDVVHSRKWGRNPGGRVDQFETAYATLTGAKHCLATANGTSALLTSVGVLDI